MTETFNDKFSEAFRELYLMTMNSEYSIYRDPYTGETKYYMGKLPQETGLPANIDEGTPEALAYKEEQIKVYGMPGQFLDDKFINTKKEGQQNQIVNDPVWIRASKILHKHLRNQNRSVLYTRDDENKQELSSDKEYAEWGVDFMSSFENNFTNMLIDVNKMEGAPAPIAHAMYYLLETSDRKGVLLDNFINGVYYSTMDYANLLGLGTFGIGLIGRAGGKQMTKTAFKEYLKDLVIRKPDAAEAALGVETATYMAGFDYGGQKVKVAADKQEEIDKGQLAASAVAGGIAGPAAGRVIEGTGKAIGKGVSKVAEKIKPTAETQAMRDVAPILDTPTTEKNKE